MADEKKDKKPGGWNLDLIEGGILLLLLLGMLSAVLPSIERYFSSGEVTFFGYPISGAGSFFQNYTWLFKLLGFVAAIAAAVYALIFKQKTEDIEREERAKVYPAVMEIPSDAAEPAKNPLAESWDKILLLSDSTNASDWRMAVIQADIILDDLLDKLQLPGETMGDKLKAVEKSDFLSIESAWEAHKFRNSIAHEGHDFLVSQREVKRILSLYEEVFKEFCLV